MTIIARLTACLIAATTIATVASPTMASQRRSATTTTYRVTYEGDRDVYCIRFFADAEAADPRPGRPGVTCRSRAAWAKQGVQISDPHVDMEHSARS
ncbi:hypothetical protein QH494_18690 [Sphingomonas sp. AR_OL41]|uniref:hypothetical protein n=1 Tax=Sphingomonas sp. AR_OL41 TaxID=3042729 RepID=UPI00248179C8|nr:hypothetical protein [Sphingomonas sp. AR_OL41]MDH7974221.1 hypothetical protein [Sphingomonas sp. AR_OL41]